MVVMQHKLVILNHSILVKWDTLYTIHTPYMHTHAHIHIHANIYYIHTHAYALPSYTTHTTHKHIYTLTDSEPKSC